MSMRRSIPILLAALLAADLADARRGDRDQPMDVRADSQVGGLGESDSIVFVGNVEIDQGSLSIRAARATVERQDGEIVRIVLEGSPVRMDQLTDRGEPVNATAARVVYNPTDEIIVLNGAAQVVQPRGTMSAEVIRYNMTTGSVDAGGDGGRVRTVIQPRARTAGP
ncbi:MAG TPA: lipopolysaccharide transport periplasmic protein LptA [Xanthomonadaceae bacterium]|jgi:lipopolysaccharide export system protein LptA|nr:lipopolysaccharide transport periplasmic protein LptA [Xanthomonadaceae bacterium]